MNPISKVTGAITHPRRTATSVAGGAIGVAASSVRTATRLVGRAARKGGESSPATPSPAPVVVPDAKQEAAPVTDPAAKTPTAKTAPEPAAKTPPAKPVRKTPPTSPAKSAKKTTAKPAKKTAAKPATQAAAKPGKQAAAKPARKTAPTAQAATAGPAMTPDALAAIDAAVDGDTTHVETETEVVYTSATETDAATGAEDTLTEPLLDPALAEALKSEAEVLQSGADGDKG